MTFINLCNVILACVVLAKATTSSFKPSLYDKTTVVCEAIRRTPSKEGVNIDIKYVDINPGAPTSIIMVHGWPSLWSSWSNQIQEFQEDYHLVIPDLRGFGESTHPGDAQSSGTLQDMVNDLVCVLKDAKTSSAICMGHDWGSAICYEAARLRPDIFTAVIGVVVPYVPSAGPYVPIQDLTPHFPTLTYQLFFDHQPQAAVDELERDIRRTIRGTLRTFASPPPIQFLKSNKSFLDAWSDIEEIPAVPFFSPEEEDYFVDQYTTSGFKHTLQFYSNYNRFLGWKIANEQGNHTISQPVLAIYPTEDPVADWVEVSEILQSASFLPNLTTKVLPGSHWVHLEYPEKFNFIVRQWLMAIVATKLSRDSGFGDEL
ncbi:Epoxide hydrolase A [Psilocybe cubensis]|uniref:AB hydrolase-1 domain-containing protein n=2 Tax=Psilocybe cubensis TaxID=181762 RepID=A0A8H7XMP7_PSICU|nr:Epoxide hydrolase A [Psilocybe cubensis]KAH9483194.1 Epoxide hydrolase A [Psilocybe cubensis]